MFDEFVQFDDDVAKCGGTRIVASASKDVTDVDDEMEDDDETDKDESEPDPTLEEACLLYTSRCV